MKLEIKSRWDGHVIYSGEAETLKDLVGTAVRSHADLGGANLYGANLGGADLSGADLRGACLYGADLGGAKNIWMSHEVISEILWQASKGVATREQFAAWIGRKTCWCWKEWLKVEHPERDWALSVLLPMVQDGDNAPDEVRAMVKKEEKGS